jgi:hypothetical protein
MIPIIVLFMFCGRQPGSLAADSSRLPAIQVDLETIEPSPWEGDSPENLSGENYSMDKGNLNQRLA